MQTPKIYLVVILNVILGYYSILNSQVTVGSNLEPNIGALLDLKENDNIGANSTKGVLLPRVELTSNSSSKFIPQDSNTDEYAGMIVYNIGKEIIDSPETRLCQGVHIWQGNKWIPLSPYPEWVEGVNIGSCYPALKYTLDCNTIKIYGNYKNGVTLDNTHYVEVTINTSSEMIGEEYILESYTENPEEIIFRAKGTIQNTTQVVKMKGKGVVKSSSPISFKLLSNSNSASNQCLFTINIILPKLHIVGVGEPNYHPASMAPKSKSHVLMSNPKAFGTSDDAKVKIEGFTFENYKHCTKDQWIAIFESKPDIVIRTYATKMDNDAGEALKKYLDEGGIVLDFNDNNSSSSAGVKALYGSEASSNQSAGTGGKLMYFDDVDDEILNGVWGDLRGKTWAEDASTTQGIKGVPLDQIIIYTTSTYGTQTVVMFRDKKVNYVYIGDGGFLSGAASSSSCCYPFQLDSRNMPIAAYGGVRYNSIFFANLITWALKEASVHGINRR